MTSRRLVGLLLGVLGLLVLPAAPALAHTEQVSVSPAPGSSTTGSVPAVEIDFSDAVLPGLARVVVRDARGRDHVAGRLAVLGGRVSARLDEMEARLTNALAELRELHKPAQEGLRDRTRLRRWLKR